VVRVGHELDPDVPLLPVVSVGIGGSTRPLEPPEPGAPLPPGAGRFGGRGSATVSSRPVSPGRSAMVTVTPPALDWLALCI
jgi:hypothetical protein